MNVSEMVENLWITN